MRRRPLLTVAAAAALAGALAAGAATVAAQTAAPAAPDAAAATPPAAAVATFASGCFWCTESDFEVVPGVLDVVSGYTGGTQPNPSYEQVSMGVTGHTEAVEVRYDPAKVTYAQLLEVYWRNVDYLDGGGQFCDRGDQYRPAIFYHGDEQKRLAEETKAALAAGRRLDRPIATQIAPAETFYPAEDYHQDYYKKNPLRYKAYRWNCGRDQRLAELRGPAS